MDDIKNRYALMNGVDWNCTRDLKLVDRDYTRIECQFLNSCDRILKAGKTGKKILMKPGPLVS